VAHFHPAVALCFAELVEKRRRRNTFSPLDLLREYCFEGMNRCAARPRNDSRKHSASILLSRQWLEISEWIRCTSRL